MSATNQTANYQLPIFIGSDIPSWLVDWNNAMTALDTAIANALLAGQTAEADVTALEGTVTSMQTALTTLTNTVDVNSQDIDTVKGQIVAFTAMINSLTAQVQQLNDKVEAAEQTVGEVYSGIIGVGETTVTISTPSVTANSLVSVFTDEYGLVPTDVSVDAGNKTTTITVEQRVSNLAVRVLIRN